jgi:SulP family sulfate permease
MRYLDLCSWFYNSFCRKFDVLNDPSEVIIDFRESKIADMSAIALNTRSDTLRSIKVHLRHLSMDCRQLLHNAEEVIEVMEDPTYKVAVDKNNRP